MKFGSYPDSFANASLVGRRHVAIDNMPCDKTCKLTVNNS